jgi:hypothetical protein
MGVNLFEVSPISLPASDPKTCLADGIATKRIKIIPPIHIAVAMRCIQLDAANITHSF